MGAVIIAVVHRLKKDHAGRKLGVRLQPAGVYLVGRLDLVRELDELLVGLERDLYVLMAELATLPANRAKLSPGVTLVSADMVGRVEQLIDRLTERFPAVTEFVIPGGDRVAASLDVARTVVRRAERRALPAAPDGSQVVPYLNRLSDLLWTMARWCEHGETLRSRQAGAAASGG